MPQSHHRIQASCRPSAALLLVVLVGLSGQTAWAQVVTPAIAAARNSVLVLTDEALVHGHGRNADGELGLGDRLRRDLPTVASAESGITDVAAGDFHSLWVRRDGTVLAVGRNDQGQLGLGDTTDRQMPVPIAGLPPVLRAYAGRSHSLVITRTGEVWTFGSNTFGQLGRAVSGSNARETSPGRVASLSGAFGAALGQDFSVVLSRSGTNPATAFGFGLNVNGQLGFGSSQSAPTPAPLSGVFDPRMVAAGEGHLWILQADGRVFATGINGEGQLGVGDRNTRTATTLVTSLSGITAIGAGAFASFAIDTNGQLWSAGSNLFGQLGVSDLSPNTQGREPTPRQATGLPPLAAIDGGALHTVALTRDGRLIVFGSDALGQLGLASGLSQQPVPQILPGLRPGRPAVALGPTEIAYGNPLTWFLGGYPPQPFALYAFDATGMGTSPGFFIPGPNLSVPLNPPLLFLQGAAALGTSSFRGFLGVLDADGRGSASLDVPDDPLLAGVALDAALLIFDRTGQPALVSAPSRTQIVAPAPVLVSATPRQGGTSGGTVVTLRGAGFTPGMTATFGSAAATGIVAIDARTLQVTAPPGAAGFVDITLTDGSNRTTSLVRGFEYRLTDPTPTVTAIQPSIGPISGGLTIAFTGADFRPGANVEFGTARSTLVTVLSPTSLTAVLPPGVLGPVAIKVTNPSSAALTLSDGFVYVDDLAITAILPAAPAALETVVIQGRGFLPGVQVALNGAPLTLTSASIDRLSFSMPAGLGCDLALVVQNPGGISASRTLAPTPAISFVFGSGAIRPGDPVPVFGTGFDARVTATVQGLPAAVTFVAPTQVNITAPLLPPGTVAVLSLTSGAGCSATSAFVYGF